MSHPAPLLEVQNLTHRFDPSPAARPALGGVSLDVAADEIVCLVGPSGCGKSTLLRAVAGLLVPSSGRILLHGHPLSGVPADLAFVFQDYGRSLFPWLSVRGNVEFPLRGRGNSRAGRRARAERELAGVGLAGVGDRYPWQLSGGMQQRVAIARALAVDPALLLMDEPFASVDAQTRWDLEDLLRRVQRDRGGAVLLVTHDVDEAVYLGDRVLVLSDAPAAVLADLPVDLPPDRDQISTRELPGFVALRSEVARMLRRTTPSTGPYPRIVDTGWSITQRSAA